MDNYTIRAFGEADADALNAVTFCAIQGIGPAGYSAEQVNVWAARHNDPERLIQRARDGATILVAVTADDIPAAFALLEPDGHLDQLYCAPEHSRRGQADRLLAIAEEKARALGLSRLYTEASELARPAFERAGYQVTHRRDFDLDGVRIHNYAMDKLLK